MDNYTLQLISIIYAEETAQLIMLRGLVQIYIVSCAYVLMYITHIAIAALAKRSVIVYNIMLLKVGSYFNTPCVNAAWFKWC